MQSENCDHWDKAVLHRVTKNHGSFAKALRAGGAEIVLTEDVEEARAYLPQIDRQARGRQRDRGQDQTLQVFDGVRDEVGVTARGKEAERQREDQDEDDAQIEVGQGHARDRETCRN